MHYKAPPLFLVPGNIVLMASSNPCPPIFKSVKAGQARFVGAETKVSVINCNGASSTEKSDDNKLGARVLTASKTKQSRLLPSRRVSAFKIPPVKSSKLTPVKLLTVPVFPPMLMWVSNHSINIRGTTHLPRSGYSKIKDTMSEFNWARP